MVVLLKTIRLLAAARHETGKPSLAPFFPQGGTGALFHRHHGVGDRANTCQDTRHGKRLATYGPGRPPSAEHAVLTKTPDQKSIWSQINGGHSNDYIFFHMRKADGTYISVLDHDRIVDSVHNGRVFYVMIMDLKSLQRHYGDCLELVEK
mgnify:CR=1 FL=1